ncbi:hypothetical protein [Streptomyces wuyuanensis]|uniref:hypothetical protein n=1 Tax=Streptomyces wuyuanensis TaxID=1196353 RepID=UPI00344613AA
MPEIAERHCRRCGQRCRRGWLRVLEQGQIEAPGANLKRAEETVYCSERCLRTQLLEAAGNMQLIVDLQREVDRLREQRHNRRSDEDFRDQQVAELRAIVYSVADQAVAIRDGNLTEAEPGSEKAAQLRIVTTNILRLLRPALEPPRS